MSTTTTTRRSHRRRRSAAPLALTAAVLVVVAVSAISLLTGAGADGVQATGQTNAMGVPVIATPGEATGAAAAGTVEVSAANWALGQVPLDVAVQPTWTLRNTGVEPVTLGEPHAEVLAGCCPGPLTLDATTVAPGESTTLTFDLAMHEGMDGWHDMAVHVPVGERGDVLTLGVTADFRN